MQPGIRLEKRQDKLLKGLAQQQNRSLGDLIESNVLECFKRNAHSEPKTLQKIQQLKDRYDLDLIAAAAHH